MKKTLKILIVLSIATLTFAQYPGQWGVNIGATGNLAVGELKEWFFGGYNVEIGIGQQQDSPWYVEGIVDYSTFSSTHYVGAVDESPVQAVPLSLWYIGFMAQGKYKFPGRAMRPYISIAGGPHYWSGSRGAINEFTPLAIPAIPKKILSEWNMGFKVGAGFEFLLSDAFSIDAALNYRLVIGSLWPTMQEYVELEAVNGFSSVGLTVRGNIYF